MPRIVFTPSSGMCPAGRGLFAGASALNNQHHLALQTVPKGALMGCGCQHQRIGAIFKPQPDSTLVPRRLSHYRRSVLFWNCFSTSLGDWQRCPVEIGTKLKLYGKSCCERKTNLIWHNRLAYLYQLML